MSQMPEIKPIINKEPERDKKKAGLFARWFGGGSGGAGLGGLGELGGGSGGLGGFANGGLLATKAGLLALILAGTTVAGGIGMLGYRLFGPGSDGSGSGDNLQLFAPKPKDGQNADGQAASKDGTSASLQYLNQANKTAADGTAANTAPTDATAGSATAADAAAAAATVAKAAGANGPINKMGDGGNGNNKGMLKNVAKFGTLEGTGSANGSGAAVASSAAQKTAGDALASKGSLSGFKKANAATVSGGTARSIAGQHFGGAAGQAFGALHSNQNGAASSQQAGATYDGAGTAGSNITGGGTPIGAPGVAPAGAAGAQPTSVPGPANSVNSSSSIPTPVGTPAAPWQSQITEAQALIGVASAILLACALINQAPSPTTLIITRVLGGIVAAIGLMVAVIGGTISNGKYAQLIQGGILGAAGAGLVLAGAMAATSSNTSTTKPPADVTDPDTGGVQYANGFQTDGQGGVLSAPGSTLQSGDPANIPDGVTTSTNSVFGPGGISGISTFVLLGGGLGLFGLVGTMMMPPTKYPASDANDPNWPKSGLIGYQQFPSEKALKKMVA